MAVFHSIAAILAILAFIVHVHMVTWERGTLRAMTRGAVTAGWGWKHHRKWLREVGRKGKTGARAAE
jgi:formate dehydrogenase subunit gamma